jgi:hypothetical protein
MELYSRTPPHMAPSKFIAMTLETHDSLDSIEEKTRPEKNIGQVRSRAVPRRPRELLRVYTIDYCA